MANLSNINNKLIVQDNSRVLVNKTSDTGATLQVGGSLSTDSSVRVGDGVLYVGNGTNTTTRIMGFGDYEMITGVSGATYLRVSGSNTLAGTLQAGQYILADGLAYGAVNSYTQIIDGTTGVITGTSASFTGDVSLVDSKQLKLGNGADLLIFHDGANSYVKDNGTGNLLITSNGASVQINKGTTENMAEFITDGAVKLYYDSALKFETTSTGVSVTGDVISNAILQANGFRTTTGSTDYSLLTRNSSNTAVYIQQAGSGNILDVRYGSQAAGQGTSALAVMGNGNVGIGTGSPSTKLSLEDSTANGAVQISFKNDAREWRAGVHGGINDSFTLYDNTAGATRLVVDSSGNVGIGTTSPGDFDGESRNLVIRSGVNGSTPTIGMTIATDGDQASSGRCAIRFADGINGNERYRGALEYNHNGDDMSFRTAGTQKMTLTSAGNLLITNGNVGIGTTSPGAKLQIGSATNAPNGNLTNNLLQIKSPSGFAYLTIGNGDTANATSYIGGASGFIVLGSVTDAGATSEHIRMTNSGSVGIGTTSPEAKLDISNVAGATYALEISTPQRNRALFYYNSASASDAGYLGIKRGSVDALNHRFATTGNSAVCIGEGNFGIGTDSPTSPAGVAKFLEIEGSTAGIVLHDDGNDPYEIWASGGNLVFRYNNTQGENGMLLSSTGNLGIGTTDPDHKLEIGGTANPVVAIVSNINSATSSLYFGDSDAKDRGQVKYTHFGDFMELKAGGGTRLYIESGINTAYTSDGLFNSNATPSYWNHGNAQFKIGYMDNGSGLYSGAYSFNVKSTDGIPVTGREIGAIYINDVSNGRKPLIISNQGRITMDQTNTSLANSNTGWLTIANGTSAYNFYNAYTGTDGGSGCARYRLNNTSPSFFDFYYTTTQVGYITTNGTDIFYANTSDYRLKEDLKSFDGMSLLEQIQVYDFKWKESDNRMYGVVAHELQEVVPQAVVGDKDQEKLQAVDYSKLVPILIKSIQELKAEIELLKNN